MDPVARFRQRLREQRESLAPTPPGPPHTEEGPTPWPETRPTFSHRGVYSLESATGGRTLPTVHGDTFVIERYYELHHLHGSHTLGDFLAQSPAVLAYLARADDLTSVNLQHIVFLDTETTGLAGGTGTYVFLVGLGQFEAETFMIRQFFLRDPGEEDAFLAAVADVLSSCHALVTFNGRSFDLPLIETRFILARQRPPALDRPHLDLLHPARRLWRDRLSSCALSALERNILDVARAEDDVPGWLIPTLYRDFLSNGDARPMERVAYHNRMDILSMVTLAIRLGLSLSNPATGAFEPQDLLSLARWFEELNLPERAEETYRLILGRDPLAPAWRAAALNGLAYHLKRRERRAEAVLLWYDLIDLEPGYIEAYVELAKYYEWHAGDLRRATEWTRRALVAVERRSGLRGQAGADWAAVRHELLHRLERLERKAIGLPPGE